MFFSQLRHLLDHCSCEHFTKYLVITHVPRQITNCNDREKGKEQGTLDGIFPILYNSPYLCHPPSKSRWDLPQKISRFQNTSYKWSHQNRGKTQLNRNEIYSILYQVKNEWVESQMIFSTDAKKTHGEKHVFFNEWHWNYWKSIYKNVNLGPYLTLHTRINLKWITD